MSKRRILDAEQARKLPCHLGLADAGRAGEEVAADGLLGITQASAGQLDRRRKGMDSRFLAEHHALQVGFEVAQELRVRLRHRLGRNASHGRNRRLHLLHADGALPLRRRQQHLRRARLVDHVDRLVGQLPVVDVFRGKLDRGLDRLVRVFDVVEVLEVRLEALHDLEGVFDRRLRYVDLLETPDERPVLLEVLAVFLVGRGADAAEHARLQRRLQEVRRIHCAARSRARADHGMDLVDEQDRAGIGLDFLHDGLQPLFEIAAIARSGEQRAHVEREHGCVRQHLRHLAAHDFARQAFSDRGLADAGVADIERVVLGPAAKHLDRPLDFLVAPDQRIDAAILGLLVEIDAIRLKRVG